MTCKEDLIGEVGVTVTGVDGATIDYEMTPAVSREQLEATVARLVSVTGAMVDGLLMNFDLQPI